jgi:hypothetical protein
VLPAQAVTGSTGTERHGTGCSTQEENSCILPGPWYNVKKISSYRPLKRRKVSEGTVYIEPRQCGIRNSNGKRQKTPPTQHSQGNNVIGGVQPGPKCERENKSQEL